MENKESRGIPKGTLFTVTAGEYSSYCVIGVFRALDDIHPAKIIKDLVEENPDLRSIKYPEYLNMDPNLLLGFLTRKGLIEPIPSMELWLSDWDLESEIFTLSGES